MEDVGQGGDVSDVSGVVREDGSWKCKEFVLFLREADEGVNVRRWGKKGKEKELHSTFVFI